MKTKLFLCAILVGLLAHADPGVLRTNVTLVWNFPTNQLSTNLTFRLYSFTNLSQPRSQWQVFTNVTGTNLSVVVPVQPNATYFTLTASNLVGESDFSNAALQPTPPQAGALGIQ